MFDYRSEFPILERRVHDNVPLIYLDNANTTQKPSCVIERMDRFYREQNANIHRGVHTLSQEATKAFEGVREDVRRFINAAQKEEIVFTRSGTEALNLIAQTLGKIRLEKGKKVLISEMEHHSNIVPWKLICDEMGAQLVPFPITANGDVDMEAYEALLDSDVAIVACTHVSNALGTVTPIKEIITKAHRHNIPVIVDGCQALCHLSVDVRDLDADFYVGTGHKLYGPTGTGFIYGKKKYWDTLPPYQGGGDMILSVSFEQITYAEVPHRFEAGTPNIAGMIGLGEAIGFLERVGMEKIREYEAEVMEHTLQILQGLSFIRVIGMPQERAGVVSFVVDGVHPHDVGSFLDQKGIAVRTGHHCTQPVMKKFGVPATVRLSLGLYNTKEEIEVVGTALQELHHFFTR